MNIFTYHIRITALCLLCLALPMHEAIAQENAVVLNNLKSLQIAVNGEWGEPPVALLGGDNFVEISFDDLQHNYVRYTYRIVHCNADWSKSDLLESEYMTGFNDARIEEYTQSMNTEFEYNHYTLCIPNEDVEINVSGNYKVEIMTDDKVAAVACFSVLDPRIGIDAEVSGNTDIDTYSSHQQVSFNVNYKGYNIINPQEEIKPVVVQNGRWDNRVEGVKPTYLRNAQLSYVHNPRLIFEAGNEYRRFEILDERVPTMRVDKIQYVAPYYHATLFTDEPRHNYIFDKDQNGRYWVRNNDNVENDTESDYFLTHFKLEMPQISGGEVYINGELTNNRLCEEYRMTYNLIEHAYESTLPLKQGSYNYQYLFVRNGSNTGTAAYTEGNFFQTENEYYIYVYHRPFGARYDKLIGFQKIQFVQ